MRNRGNSIVYYSLALSFNLKERKVCFLPFLLWRMFLILVCTRRDFYDEFGREGVSILQRFRVEEEEEEERG